VSALMHEYLQMMGIVAAILINAVIGFLMDYRAQVSLQKLAQLAAPTARVRRSGKDHKVKVQELVRGDIVLLEAGDSIPADMHLGEGASGRVSEARLPGESVPGVKAAVKAKSEDDRSLYQGTIVQAGRAVACVTNTGQYTRLGKMDTTMRSVEKLQTPLELEL